MTAPVSEIQRGMTIISARPSYMGRLLSESEKIPYSFRIYSIYWSVPCMMSSGLSVKGFKGSGYDMPWSHCKERNNITIILQFTHYSVVVIGVCDAFIRGRQYFMRYFYMWRKYLEPAHSVDGGPVTGDRSEQGCDQFNALGRQVGRNRIDPWKHQKINSSRPSSRVSLFKILPKILQCLFSREN